MNSSARTRTACVGAFLVMAGLAGGCSHRHACTFPIAPPNPLGYASDPMWMLQETGGEASDFVIYDHEFAHRTSRLTPAGEDHVKQIAARVGSTPFPVVVERTNDAVNPNDEFQYPVHHNPVLDLQRRDVVVRSLLAMNVRDANDRVVVAPAIAEGFEEAEAEGAYLRGLGRQNTFGNGNGGGFGYFGGSGFIGGLGF